MTTREDIIDRLVLAGSRVRGPERSALVAEAVTWADEIGDDQLAVDARLELLRDYAWGGEEWKGLAPFAWCLGRQVERPDLFDTQRLRALRWNYKWAVNAAACNPAVGVEQVRALEDGMEAFYREQGASMHGVHGQRYYVARALGQDAEARAELVAWRATPRDENSDCEACDPVRQVEAAVRDEDWELAVATAVPVLRGDLGCDEQPADMQGAALLALVASGRPRAAWDAHVRAYRRHRTSPRHADSLGLHLAYLALSGHVDRGLTILRRHATWTAQADSARDLLDLLVGVALVLREAARTGRGEEVLGVELPESATWCPGPHVDATTPVARAHEDVLAWARTLAAAYDRRNGTTAVGEDVEHRLTREPLVPDGGAAAHVELLEAPEAMPEAPAREPEPSGAAPAEGTTPSAPPLASASSVHSVDDVPVAPYPVVQQLRLSPPVDLAEAVERLAATGPGDELEHAFLVDELRSRRLLDVPTGSVGTGEPADAVEQVDAVDLEMAAAALASSESRFEDAAAHWRRARSVLIARLGVDPGTQGRLRLADLDVRTLAEEVRADAGGGRSAAGEERESLARLDEVTAALAGAVRLLGEAAPTEHVLLAVGAVTRAGLLLCRCGRADAVPDLLGLIGVLVGFLERAGSPAASAARDALDLVSCEMLASRGEIYRSCALADSLLRRHDVCPASVAVRAHTHIGQVSLQFRVPEDAVVHLREAANTCLAAGLRARSVDLLDVLARALGASGRSLEAAEVLETALSVAQGAGLDALGLRRTLVLVLAQLEEHEGLCEAAVICAEAEIAQGWIGEAVRHLEMAADAALATHDPLGAAALYRRCAELVDVVDDGGRLDRARFLQQVGRSLTSHTTVSTNRGYLDEAMGEFGRAEAIVSGILDQAGYSSTWERAAVDEEVARALWRCDERSGAFGAWWRRRRRVPGGGRPRVRGPGARSARPCPR